jgi:hypothetical protein
MAGLPKPEIVAKISDMTNPEKKIYERPAVRVAGKVEEITLANDFRTKSDGVFVTVGGHIASLGS